MPKVAPARLEAAIASEPDDFDLEDEGLLAADEAPPSMRRKLFLLCEDPTSSPAANWMANVMTAVITLSIISFCLETTPELKPYISATMWLVIEGMFVFVFTVEFAVRLIVTESHKVFWLSKGAFLNYVDVISILPFYFEVVAKVATGVAYDGDNGFLRLIKLCRVLRVFKIARHFSASRILARAFKASFSALLVPMFFLQIFVLIFASVIYFMEGGDKGGLYTDGHEQFVMKDGVTPAVFTDIFNAAYFIMVTMTTVGYGDQIPQTSIGKGAAIMTMLFGSFFMSMPLAIIGNNFEASWEKAAQEERLKQGIVDENPHRILKLNRDQELMLTSFLDIGSTMVAARKRLELLSTEVGEPDWNQLCVHASATLDTWLRQHVRYMKQLRVITHVFDDIAHHHQKRQRTLRALKVSSHKIAILSSLYRRKNHDVHDVMAAHDGGWRDKLFLLLEVPESSASARHVHNTFLFFVVWSVVVFCLETLPELWDVVPTVVWNANEYFLAVFFTLELGLRLLVARSQKKFWSDPYNYFDVVAVLPYFVGLPVQLLMPDHVRTIKFIRLLGVFRIFKMSRHFHGSHIIVEAFNNSVPRLMVPLFFLMVFILIFASVLFVFEQGDLDAETGEYLLYGKVSPFTDIIRSGWVIIVTMTSVGYGGVTPQTMIGKGVCLLAALFGTFYLAMPLTIVGSKFWQSYEKSQIERGLMAPPESEDFICPRMTEKENALVNMYGACEDTILHMKQAVEECAVTTIRKTKSKRSHDHSVMSRKDARERIQRLLAQLETCQRVHMSIHSLLPITLGLRKRDDRLASGPTARSLQMATRGMPSHATSASLETLISKGMSQSSIDISSAATAATAGSSGGGSEAVGGSGAVAADADGAAAEAATATTVNPAAVAAAGGSALSPARSHATHKNSKDSKHHRKTKVSRANKQASALSKTTV